MNTNQVNTPSFGRVYLAANSKAARAALSKYINIVKEQTDVLNKLDKNDYDVFINMSNQTLDVVDEAEKILKIEIRKKLMPPFTDESTPFLILKDNETAVKAFVACKKTGEDIKAFFSKIGDSIKNIKNPDFD